MPAIAAPLIVNQYATLQELETYYSLEDALNLIEALRVKIYNEEVSARRARAEQKSKGLN